MYVVARPHSAYSRCSRQRIVYLPIALNSVQLQVCQLFGNLPQQTLGMRCFVDRRLFYFIPNQPCCMYALII